jgi:uncharacterized protein (TIGR02145 family)
MKKLFTFFLIITLVYSCSNSSDENGDATAVPLPPTNLTGTIVSSTQINLSWTDNSTDETGFKIERKTLNGIYEVVGTTGSNVNTFNNTGLTTNTTYVYRIYSYNSGGNSTTYSNEITIFLSTIPYVTIGNQIWQSSNLNVTTYSDGTPIPEVTDITQWTNLTTGAWCYYNNNSTNGIKYGKLYNWYAVAGIHDNDPNTPNKILAPTGWSLPTDAEWTALTTFLGGEGVAGGKMKDTGVVSWRSPNSGATNESLFTALPGGNRSTLSASTFAGILEGGVWWSSSEIDATKAWHRYILYNQIYVVRLDTNKTRGCSVRCIRRN